MALLDLITTLFAFDIKKVVAGYNGPWIRVQRHSDDYQQDIGFDADGNGDWAAAAALGSDIYLHTCYNQSGGAVNFVQSVKASQPLVDPAAQEFVLDGIDDFLVTGAPVDLSGTDSASIFFRRRLAAATGTQIFYEHGANAFQDGAAGFASFLDGGAIDIGAHTNTYNIKRISPVDLGTHIISTVINRSAADPNDILKVWRDGAPVTDAPNNDPNTGGAANFESHYLYLGARAGAQFFLNAAFKGFIIMPTAATEEQRTAIEASLGFANGESNIIPLAITSPAELPSVQTGAAASVQLTAQGGGVKTWTLTGGAGIAAITSSGLLSYQSATEGIFEIAVQVTDDVGGADSQLFSVEIANPPSSPYLTPETATIATNGAQEFETQISSAVWRVIGGGSISGGSAPKKRIFTAPNAPGQTFVEATNFNWSVLAPQHTATAERNIQINSNAPSADTYALAVLTQPGDSVEFTHSLDGDWEFAIGRLTIGNRGNNGVWMLFYTAAADHVIGTYTPVIGDVWKVVKIAGGNARIYRNGALFTTTTYGDFGDPDNRLYLRLRTYTTSAGQVFARPVIRGAGVTTPYVQTADVTYLVPPVAGFEMSTETLEATQTLEITDTSTGVDRTYAWKVNGFLRSTQAQPNLTRWLVKGQNTIKQEITSNGWTDARTKTVTCVPKLIPVENADNYQITGLTAGLPVFASVKAVDMKGRSSAYSNTDQTTVS